MKTVKTFVIGLLTLMFISCEKNEIGPGPKLQQETNAKILGKWQLEKTVVKQYQPIDALTNTNETLGGSGDDYEFLETNTLVINTSGNQLLGSFEVYNPFQVMLNNDSWFINVLSKNQLILKKDRYQVEYNKRVYMEMTFRR